MVACLVSLLFSASVFGQCPAGSEDRIEFEPAYCAMSGSNCSQDVTLSWCLNGSGEPAFLTRFGNVWDTTIVADGMVHQRRLETPPVDQKGYPVKLWRGVPDEDPTFVDGTRLHRERSHGEPVTRNWFSMRAMPAGGCERDPHEQQICDDSGNLEIPSELTGDPAMEPAVQWALMGINPDAYDFEIQVTTRNGDVHRINPVMSQPDLEDPNVPFDEPYTLSLAEIPSLQGSEHPWMIEAILASKLTGESLLDLGTVWIRVAPNGRMVAEDTRCLPSEPEICSVPVDEIVAHNFFRFGPEQLELRRADGSVVWSADVPEEAPTTGQFPGPEVLLSYPDYQRPEELTLYSRALGCEGEDQETCTDTDGPYLYERELDRLTAWTGDFQATLTTDENPCLPVERMCGNDLQYRCEPTLTVKAKMHEHPWQVGLVKVGSSQIHPVACIQVPSGSGGDVYEQQIALGCNNSPGDDDSARSFALVQGCPSGSQNLADPQSLVSLDDLELRSHHLFEESVEGNEYLVCSETGESLDPESGGSLGVIINELQLPEPTSGGACDPGDLEYQRAVAVAEQLPAGTRYVRRTIRWPDVEPQSGQKDFSAYQCLLEPFFERGYEAFLTLGRTPAWACRDEKPEDCETGDPPNLEYWESFVVATLETFALGEHPVLDFEVWQEPENKDFSNLTLGDYREILKAAHDHRCVSTGPTDQACARIWAPNSVFSSFKRANKAEFFLRGVLAPDPETELPILDGVAIHAFFKIDDVSSGIATSVDYTRRLMDSIVDSGGQAIYDDVPIAVTAVSVASVPRTVEGCLMEELEAAERTAYLEETFVCGLSAGAEAVIWYSATDERFWQCGVEQATGLDRATGAGILKWLFDPGFDHETTDLTKPEMAAPFSQIGCGLSPVLPGCAVE